MRSGLAREEELDLEALWTPVLWAHLLWWIAGGASASQLPNGIALSLRLKDPRLARPIKAAASLATLHLHGAATTTEQTHAPSYGAPRCASMKAKNQPLPLQNTSQTGHCPTYWPAVLLSDSSAGTQLADK